MLRRFSFTMPRENGGDDPRFEYRWCVASTYSYDRYREKYPHAYDGPAFDWPQYREVREDEQTVEHIRYMYASLLSFCDAMLGRVLDTFDRLDLWKVRSDSALSVRDRTTCDE